VQNVFIPKLNVRFTCSCYIRSSSKFMVIDNFGHSAICYMLIKLKIEAFNSFYEKASAPVDAFFVLLFLVFYQSTLHNAPKLCRWYCIVVSLYRRRTVSFFNYAISVHLLIERPLSSRTSFSFNGVIAIFVLTKKHLHQTIKLTMSLLKNNHKMLL